MDSTPPKTTNVHFLLPGLKPQEAANQAVVMMGQDEEDGEAVDYWRDYYRKQRMEIQELAHSHSVDIFRNHGRVANEDFLSQMSQM